MRWIILLSSTLALSACGGDTTDTDAGGGPDAGPAVDSGATDGGPAPDAGGRIDAGPGDDAGASDAGVSDAGASDAGASDAGASDAGVSDAGPSDAGRTGLPVGTSGCASDSECASGVCWNYRDYDSACFGTVCSVTCLTRNDCMEAARMAGASDVSRAICGTDRRCSLVGTGLGVYGCAGPGSP